MTLAQAIGPYLGKHIGSLIWLVVSIILTAVGYAGYLRLRKRRVTRVDVIAFVVACVIGGTLQIWSMATQ